MWRTFPKPNELMLPSYVLRLVKELKQQSGYIDLQTNKQLQSKSNFKELRWEFLVNFKQVQSS